MADDRKDFWLCKRCADAIGADMGPDWDQGDWVMLGGHSGIAMSTYDPLHNDFQAMELVKKFKLWCGYDDTDNGWKVAPVPYDGKTYALSFDLNRAIVECVAGIRRADSSTHSTKEKS